MTTSGRNRKKDKLPDNLVDLKAFDFNRLVQKKDSGTDDDTRQETPITDKSRKRSKSTFDDEDQSVGVGNEVEHMLEKFGADINKAMLTKKKRLEALTKHSLEGSTQKLEQMWKLQQGQRQKLTQDYSQQVASVLQQWDTDSQRSDEQQEKFNNLFRQQQQHLQQSRVVQNQKMKTIKELNEAFLKNLEEMEKGHETFLQNTQLELRKEMSLLQNKILKDMQQQGMANVRKSLLSTLF